MSARPSPQHQPVALSANVIELRPGIRVEPTSEPASKPAPKRGRKAAANRLGRPPKHLQRGPTNAPDLQREPTPSFGKNTNAGNALQQPTWVTHYKGSDVVSEPTANAPTALLPKREFVRLVASLPAMKLRERFRSEEVAHRAMLQRRRSGAVIHPEFVEFASFLLHVGQRPNPSWTLDRLDSRNPMYGPGLAEWADPRTQANNRKRTVFLKARGETMPLTDWARRTGQDPDTIRARLARGWTHEQAVYGRKQGAPAKPPPKTVAGRASPPADEWPAGATASYWDGPLQAFAVKARPHLSFRISRALFFAWIGSNKLRAANVALKRDFPTYNDPEADPEDAPDVRGHPSAAVIETYTLKTGEAVTALMSDFTALEALRYLCRRFPNVYNPEDAPKLSLREVDEE